MCSAQCPTYVLTQDETESPRGRISLINAWAQGKIESGDINEHLENCLHCGQCERICPSGVSYNSLLSDYKANTRWFEHLPSKSQQMVSLLRDNTQRTHFFRQLYRYQRWGLRTLGRITGILKLIKLDHQERLLPTLQRPQELKPLYPATTSRRGTVALFTGCVSRYVEQDVITAGVSLLNQAGYDVVIPDKQACCGALARHNGEYEGFAQDQWDNLQAFQNENYEAIIYFASGCGATLNGYEQEFAGKLRELSDFLATHWEDQSTFPSAGEKTILIHRPCTERNALRAESGAVKLLGLLPQIVQKEVPSTQVCCGAGGTHLLEQSEINKQLRHQLIDDISTENPQVVVTTNTGCSLQIQLGLKERGLDIQVLHPVVLFERLIKGHTP